VLKGDEEGLWFEMQEFERQLQRSPLLVRDADINDFVRTAACRVAGPYCDDVRIYVVRNAGFNASMAPNGMMIVWTGVLTRVESEDELATILGHEIAHYTRTHSIDQWRRVKSGMAAGQVLSLGIGIATGVMLPVGESLALLSALSFSREQEQEADLLGAHMMVAAGMNPHATYRIWELLIEEEKRAVDKGDQGFAVFRTHPNPEARSKELRAWALELYGPAPETPVDERFVSLLTAHYRTLMDDQIDTNRYSRTEVLLERHAALGVDPALVHYYRGEMYRQRGADGDSGLACDAYLASVATGRAVPEAYRNLGYLYLKAGDRTTARENFRKYLESAPWADDRSMIESYLVDEEAP
jgi:predicted Zn-dependent protease